MSEQSKIHDILEESSDEEDPIPDYDTCTEKELNKLFKTCEPAYEIQVGGKGREYLLHLAASKGSNSQTLACATSKGIIQLYDINSTSSKQIITSNKLNETDSPAAITGLRFDSTNENIFYCSKNDGNSLCYDLRSNEIIFNFHDDTNGENKPFTCIDINSNSRIVCCGTEKIRGDAFIVFYDIRQSKLLGGYWESHFDDITDVKFHPQNPDLLASCSTDGLLNVFDIKKSVEDDALQVSFNTESSPSVATWYKDAQNIDHLSCITHTNDLQLYNVSTNDKVLEMSRELITTKIQRNSTIDCHLIGCHTEVEGNGLFLLATSNFNKGECLRSLKLLDDEFKPSLNFTRGQQIIRCSEYNPTKKLLFTGGEDGKIQLWVLPDIDTLPTDAQKLKEKSKHGTKVHKKVKPY